MRTILLVTTALLAAAPVAADEGTADSSTQRVDEVLTALEQRGDGLHDIRCKVLFIEKDRVNLTERRKFGELLFLITEPNPHFLIYFERSEMDGIAYKQEWYLFEGRWLYQAVERLKQVVKQEVVAPGEKFNPFDLERAPFPPPFGQKKEQILANFNVTLEPPADGDPPKTDHLVCIPKPDSRMYGVYDKLEFFVLKDVHLPGRVVVTRNDGLETSWADFPDLSAKSINTGVTKKDFEPPKAWRDYEVVVEPLPEQKPAP